MRYPVLVLVLDPDRLDEPHLRHRVEPVERVASNYAFRCFDCEVKSRVVQRALRETLSHLGAVTVAHRVWRSFIVRSVNEHETIRQPCTSGRSTASIQARLDCSPATKPEPTTPHWTW